MAMISGPYTDAIVKMLMSEDRRFFDGDVLKDPQGRFGVLERQEVWISDPVVRRVPASEFDVSHSELLRFPEPFHDTFRFTEGDGNIFLPEYKERDKAFLRRCGYCSASSGETLARLKREEGREQHKYYPISCKTGVWEEGDAEKVVFILTHLYD